MTLATVSEHQAPLLGLTAARLTAQYIGPVLQLGKANKKHTAAAVLAVVLAVSIWVGCASMPEPGRIALIVLALAVIGWAMTDISDTAIGLAAVSLLGATGVIGADNLYGSLGHEFIWLLVAALIIAAMLRQSGLIQRAMDRATHRVSTVKGLFLVLTLAIAATAFVIPSTSARAALFLPVYVALAERFSDPGTRRALALLFPTVILLSAGGSLIGAGAHIVAADFISHSSGTKVDFMSWALQAMPFAAATSLIAAAIVLRLFVSRENQKAKLGPAARDVAPLTTSQSILAAVVLVIVALWMTTPLHGLSMALVGTGGVALALISGLSPLKAKDAFKAVDLDMVLFLASTFALIGAITHHGVDKWLAQAMLASLPGGLRGSTLSAVVFVAVVSLLSHLVITSRSARASVLIPTVTMPLAALGHDPTLLIMVTILGTGFCQTLPVSSKPVALFASVEQPAFSNADLMRLSMYLLPMMLLALVAYGLLVWGP